jgi:predicted lipoprotein with Yx(FWY)xxD motif
MKTRTLALLAVLAVTALAAAGCGSSKSSKASNAASSAPAYPGETTSSAATTTSAATTPATGGGTVITVKHASKLGTILAAGPKKMTVYLFEGDKGAAASSCAGACAAVWPPVTTSAVAVVHGAAMSADLGTITRSDGTKQVTYKGHPLYFFAKDKDSGDAYGQGVHGFGSDWYVLAPSGSKVDNS